MIAGGVSFGRDFSAGEQRVSDPRDADETVAKQGLCADLRREIAQDADFQIDLTFPKRAGVFFRFGCETQTNIWCGPCQRCDQGGGHEVQKSLVGSDGESPVEGCEVQRVGAWAEDGERIAAEDMDPVAQFEGVRCRDESAPGAHK